MRPLTNRPLALSVMPEARIPHPSHHHHHSHSSHNSHAYPSHTPAPAYPPSSSHHPYHHHNSSRHVSNGTPAPAVLTGPPPMPMAILPQEAVGPPPVAVGNGHAHPGPPGPPMSPAARAAKERMDGLLSQLAAANENTWMLIGAVAEGMNNQDRALSAFEHALRHNPASVLGLNAVASIARSRDNFDKAIEYFQRILNINQENGEVWGSMGHCLLMKDDLPKAYTAYQQALYHLPNPKQEPKLWYGIGILYDRYGSFEHAEEAFSSVLKMDPNFEKANEIYFRLGIIYKHQRKFQASLECFRYILNNPPRPLTSWDIWFQLGHVYEQDRDYEAARDAYMRVLSHQPDHAKVLQQLGWLHHQPGAPFADQDKAVAYLTKSLETDGSDAQSWYLLGRAFMAGQRYNKAYEAYQQAVYRDGRNPTFWCSIGVLYYQINQYRDALDAYSRAIRLNPYISEVWYNLGSLYESCNNQITDAIDAYSRAAELDPQNATIKQRLVMLQNAGNAPLPPAPGPVDVHPSQYTATPNAAQPGAGSPNGSPHGLPGPVGDIPPVGRDLPPPPPGGDYGREHSPGPFRGGGAPPPLAHVDESRGSMSRHAPLAPMEIERPDSTREREPHRGDGPHSNGNGRYEPSDPNRRPIGAPLSPRRRDGYGPPAYAPYPSHPNAAYSRDREREEWERSRDRSRAPPSGPVDPRGPSPRLQDHVPHPSADPRQQPSPRLPPDYRGEFGRPGDYPPYGYDNRGPYPPGPDPRFDSKRDFDDIRRREDARRFDERSEANIASRHPSISRDFRPDDPRAPSPAPSSSSKAGSKRRGEKRDDDKPGSAKRVKDDKPPSKRSSGDSSTKKEKPISLRTGLRPDDEVASPSSPVASAVGSTPQQTPQRPIPSRTVDEDYDEGAADALMTLHGDRPPTGSASKDDSTSIRNGTATPGGDSPASAGHAAGNKRVDPPSPTSSTKTSPHRPKKAKGDEAASSPVNNSAAAGRRTVIEVLNTPSISSPLPPRPTPTPDVEKAESAPTTENVENETTGAGITSPKVDVEKVNSPSDVAVTVTVQTDDRPPTPPLPVSEDKITTPPAIQAKNGDVDVSANVDADVDVAMKEPETESATVDEIKIASGGEESGEKSVDA